jgi:hypothetical protein
MSFEERVAAQRAIEQVYWSHRIWPEENPGPKPPLSAVMPDDAIRARVEDSLRKSSALQQVWKRPITAEQLQAELDRMAKGSRAPEVLRELFAALGDDPFVIAETLARQTLADRLIRNWYSNDDRFHGELKQEAEAARAACRRAGCMESMGGEYRETTWRPRSEGGASDRADEQDGEGSISVDPEAWSDHLQRLARKVGGTPESLRTLEPSRVEETAEGSP